MACTTPVAFIIFNRPDLTARVFEAIRRAQPRKLLVIADGPRSSREERYCQEARAVVERVDWACELQTNFSHTNLGCGQRLSSGLNWVFSQAEEAIILEDDCLPTPSFFQFCERLLDYYRHDLRLMHISGSNFQLGRPRTPYSYYFSKYTPVWGWAAWRRAWQFYDFEVKTWAKFKAEGMLQFICPDPVESAYWEKKLDPVFEKKRVDTWDYQWNYAVWTQGGHSIVPTVNLISNIGFRSDGTHTRQVSKWANQPVSEISEIVHPPFVVPNLQADRFTFDERFGGNRLRARSTWRYHLSKPARFFKKLRALPIGRLR